MRNTQNIMGIKIDSVTMHQAVDIVKSFISKNKLHTIYTPNAEIIMDAQKDLYLRNILNEADMLVADGAGVVLASKILARKVPEKVSGIDLTRNSFSIALDRKIRYFFFGGKPGVAEEAAERLKSQYPGIEVVGCRNGYFSKDEDPDIVNQINSSEADILLVALGAPKQEKWIYEHKDILNVKICIGVGGSLDIYAGKASLAPDFFRNNGLEWLYRLYKEPWRFKRMLKLPKFVIYAVFARLGLYKIK
ncbi:MAG: WecB/TagA/CpsF family glycosyltransferase [Clostridia bacterium]|nr:WecB/TagA/CpsF family glycosyltransferase [Clostridia bacterium]